MIKKTIYFGNPCRLSKKDAQLQVDIQDEGIRTIPIEDIGMVVLDHYQIVLSNALLTALTENNVAILTCNSSHLPEGLLLPMASHHAFTEKVRFQIESSEPLRKNMWQQTVIAKIRNQANVLIKLGNKAENMLYWSEGVKSGDPDNLEARAAAYYWDNLFINTERFRRGRFGEPPNNLLNYGYAILRAVIARSLVASGLMTFMGIHHRNKYNPYCLADDIMEPYRPYVDQLVVGIVEFENNIEELTPDLKRRLLVIPSMDVKIDGQISPLMIAAQRTSASLMKCYEGEQRKLLYPLIEIDT
jgi:CRISPR-associated protein Cas1